MIRNRQSVIKTGNDYMDMYLQWQINNSVKYM